jgi:hypothetical protein
MTGGGGEGEVLEQMPKVYGHPTFNKVRKVGSAVYYTHRSQNLHIL